LSVIRTVKFDQLAVLTEVERLEQITTAIKSFQCAAPCHADTSQLIPIAVEIRQAAAITDVENGQVIPLAGKVFQCGATAHDELLQFEICWLETLECCASTTVEHLQGFTAIYLQLGEQGVVGADEVGDLLILLHVECGELVGFAIKAF